MSTLPARIKITRAVDAAFNDNTQTRLSEVGEVHEVGSPLMSEELAAMLLTVHDDPNPPVTKAKLPSQPKELAAIWTKILGMFDPASNASPPSQEVVTETLLHVHDLLDPPAP